ncbi:MAG: MFS transporter [Phycisphaerales bacterium]|nr:MFS transporter [Phycisphaerales bacterium]
MSSTARSPVKSKAMGLLIAAGLAQMIVVIDYMAVAVAMPDMARDFGVKPVDLQWVITGYVLSFSAVLGIAGPLGDRFGRKRLLLTGIAIFCGMSIWVGLANSATMVIIARISLGLGGGLLFPLATAVVSNGVTKDKLPRTLSLLTGIATIGMAIGPVVGGVFTEELSWRWVFFVNAPISILAFLAVLFFATESRDPEATGKIDVVGIILLLPGLALLAVGIDRIPHWPLAWWLGMTCTGVAILVAFVLVELRLKTPIVDLRLLGNRTFAGYLSGGTLSNSCWCVMTFATTLYLQSVEQFDAMTAGLIFLFMSVSVATASFTGPLLQKHLGTRNLVLLAIGIQIGAASLFWFDDQEPWLAIALFIAGFGCSWGWAMTQAGGIVTIPPNKVGLATGSMLTVMIMMGNMAVVVSATFIQAFNDPDGKNDMPGITASYLLALGLVVVGLLVVLLVVPRERKTIATDAVSR